MRTIIGKRRPYDRYDVRSRDCHATCGCTCELKALQGNQWGCIQLACSRRPRDLLRRLIIGIYSSTSFISEQLANQLSGPSQVLQCEGSPHSYLHDDDLYGVQGIEDEVLVWISQKGIVVCPLLSFYFSFSLFSLFFGGLNGSFYFSHLSSLGSFDFVLFGIFSSLQGQYSIFYKNIGDLSHFTKVLTKRECN